MTPEVLHPVEIFFKNWSYTAGAVMSSILFVVAIGRIVSMIGQAYFKSVSEAVKQGLINQRQDNQAEVIDEFLKVIKEQQEDIKRYCRAKENDAIDSAISKQILQSNNVTIID